jgi:L-lactate dehydrogenase (cytochrome)
MVNIIFIFRFQLYVNEDRNLTLATIKKSERLGAKVLCVTVDTPMLGRRERDMRLKFVDEAPNSLQETLLKNKDEGVARAISGWISPSFCWKDIPWLLKVSKNPVVLKGIQNGEDAVLAVKAGVSGIIVSNHGGRQLDSVRSTIEMLQEVMDALNRSNLAKKVEVYMDGGIRRG